MADVPDPTFIEGLASWELEHVSAVNTLEKKADAPEAEASDLRWKQAEEVVAALDAGMTQQRLADNWQRPDGTTYSRQHIQLVEKVWRCHLSGTWGDNRPRWNDAYNSDEVRGKKQAHVSHNSGENEWYTPIEIVDAARSVMGGIDLDPASSLAANKLIGAERIFTKADDGLSQEWIAERLWMNPPYAQPWIERFSTHLVDQYKRDNVSQACVLINNASDTQWFTQLSMVANARCDIVRRVRFWHPDRSSASPLQGQTIWYFGDNVDGFVETFATFGPSAVWLPKYRSS